MSVLYWDESGQSTLRPVCGLRPAAQSHYFYISISSQVSKGLCADPLTLSVLSWTSEGSGWLSLLEADGRPKARRPQLYEAWFEHARAMSRGIPMDDGCMAGLSQCVCVCLCERLGETNDFVGYHCEDWDNSSQVASCLSIVQLIYQFTVMRRSFSEMWDKVK